MNCGKDNVAHCGGSGGGCGRGGGDGGGRGLHGGKIKKVVSRRIGSDVTNVVDLNLRRGESDVTNVASGKGRSKKSDPKNPNKKTHVDKSSVWTHGPYVVIRSLEGKTMAYRRFGAGGCSQVDEVMVTMEMVLTMVTMVEIVMVALATSVDGGVDGGGDDGGNDGGDGDGGEGDGGDGDGSEKELIKSNGKKYVSNFNVLFYILKKMYFMLQNTVIWLFQNCRFTKNKVNRCAKDIFEQCYDGDWVTFKKVLHNVRMRLFNLFRTKYRWNRGDDQLIYDTFINMLKRRFRDIMINLRQKSKKKATDKGHKIRAGKYNFNVQRRFPPDGIPLEKWERMCSF
ncbi:hypothetical protein HanPI659440_Chr07g0260191 [Helianthus annuus]|nr:hypothetical protein HanPI659440_Chr07g0260191 [Helianthus annuus]